eukprot:GHVQ01001883.1.p1 GENE.GHVQ01001883.1~~GHVQ01001883.1.p1  ORF type:complete len:119 (+),score=22.99 GHVQ01001883.1:171-527(+)
MCRPGGIFLSVSYGQPCYRLTYLEKEELKWSVKIQTVPKPTNAVSVALACEPHETVHYVYVCRKSFGGVQQSQPPGGAPLTNGAKAVDGSNDSAGSSHRSSSDNANDKRTEVTESGRK